MQPFSVKLYFNHIFILLTIITKIHSANILFFFQLSTYSHRLAVWPLVEALANAGHNITFHQPHDSREKSHENITEFYPPTFRQKMKDFESTTQFPNFFNYRNTYGKTTTNLLAASLPFVSQLRCEFFLSSPETKNFVQNSKFDLVFVDGIFNECGYGLAHIFKAKTILFGTTHPFSWYFEVFGVAPETSTISELHVSFQFPMNFFQRITTTVVTLIAHYVRVWVHLPQIRRIYKENLGLDPPIEEVERNVTLFLYNSHYSEEMARSLPPMFIPVGGMHCLGEDKTSNLPKDMEKFILESGERGFILASFGGEAKLSTAEPVLRKIFLDSMRNSDVKFILKWDGERTAEVPPNVFTANWLPQKEILGKKNCRGFITHGGLLSMQEAIVSRVPMIAFPIFAEQDFNAFRLERTERGIRLDFSDLTTDKLQRAIYDIINDPKYKRNMEKVSKMFKDRPESPVKTAFFWTEFVLRNDGDDIRSQMRSSLLMDQYWFQIRHLDIWAAIFLSFTLIIYLFYIVFKFLIRFIASLFNTKKSDAISNSKSKKGSKVKKS